MDLLSGAGRSKGSATQYAFQQLVHWDNNPNPAHFTHTHYTIEKSAFFASTSVETNSTTTAAPSSETLFIENTYVEQWEGKHVAQWFNEIGFEILSPSFSAIDGPALLALTEEEAVQRNLIPKEMIPEVYYAISSLKRTRKHSREVLTVVNKIRVIKSHEVPDDHFQLAEKLTIPESMIKAYFKMERVCRLMYIPSSTFYTCRQGLSNTGK